MRVCQASARIRRGKFLHQIDLERQGILRGKVHLQNYLLQTSITFQSNPRYVLPQDDYICDSCYWYIQTAFESRELLITAVLQTFNNFVII